MKKIIIVISSIVICFVIALSVFWVIKFNSKPTIKNYKILHDDKFGGIYIDISIDDFNKLGFAYGDSLNIKLSNGYTLSDLPYYNGYYVDTGEKLVVSYPGYKYVKVGINYGDDLWKIANVDENTTITVTLAQKEKYIKEQLVRDIHYSDEQGNQADEEFANFRNVNVGRIKENVFFRGASPCNNEHKRAAVVDKLIKEKNINYIVNLSDSDEEINEFIFSNDFNSPYFLSLYNDNKVVALSMSMQFKADDFSEKLIQGLNNLSQSDGPFLIHCVEGKDRTGFVCMILEALAGASYDEIVDDYMLTYKNYYNITKETDLDRYNIIKEKNIDTMLKYISNINNENNIDLSTLDYEKNVTDFLVSKGMTLEDVTRLKDRITK